MEKTSQIPPVMALEMASEIHLKMTSRLPSVMDLGKTLPQKIFRNAFSMSGFGNGFRNEYRSQLQQWLWESVLRIPLGMTLGISVEIILESLEWL